MIYLYLGGIILAIGLAGFFSGSETALISCNRWKIKSQAHQGKRGALLIDNLLERPGRILSTTLVGTNLFVISASALTTGLLSHYLQGEVSLLSTIILTPILLIWGEIIPKSFLYTHSDRWISSLSRPLWWAYILFFPLVFIFSNLAWFILGLIGLRRKEKPSPLVGEDELLVLSREMAEGGEWSREENQMIERVFRFGGVPVKRIMVPLRDVCAADIKTPLRELMDLVQKTGFSKIPIYRERRENIIGVVTVNQLLTAISSTPLRKLVKPVEFVPESRSVEKLFLSFQKKGEGFAVVVGEYGGIAGVVTFEDLIEEIVGEISDEYDTKDDNSVTSCGGDYSGENQNQNV